MDRLDEKMWRLLLASSCFARDENVCPLPPCACARSLADVARAEIERLRTALKLISERQDNTSNWNEYESGYKCGTEACGFIADEALAVTTS